MGARVPIAMNCVRILAILTGFLGLARPMSAPTRLQGAAKRPIAVSDIIGMTRIAGSPYFAYRPKSGFAAFSPDGHQFAIVVFRGNVQTNTNDYSLFLFRTADTLQGFRPPRTIAAISSASNRPGIFDLKWSKDNDTIYFLGTVGSNPTQLFSVHCSSGQVNRLTDHEAALTSYSVSDGGKTIVYEAESRPMDLFSTDVLRHGFHIADEELSDLIRGSISGKEPRLFAKGDSYASDKQLRTQGELRSGYDLSLSPNGRYLVLETDAKEVPVSWRKYQDPSIKAAFRRGLQKDSPSGIMQYELIDLYNGQAERPLNSPAGYCPSTIWSPDSKSVLLCGVHLPVDVDDPQERQARRSKKFVVEIDLTNGMANKITDEDLDPVQWHAWTNIVEFQRRPSADTTQQPVAVFYQKIGNQWHRIKDTSDSGFRPRPDILVEEDLNKPPQVVAVDPQTQEKMEILGLNPELAHFQLGRVELIQWKDGSGEPISGGLYLPPNYISGRRYPLVIQTHGFDPHAFWLDGPYSSGFAAQVLAGRGIVVLQMNDIFYDSLVTRQEAVRVMRTYENAVNYLDRRGIIDRQHVGLLGFSRTCYYVKYTLTNSRQRFAAAVASDGVDASYLQYLVASVAGRDAASEFEAMIGSPPFGAGLRKWLKSSPGFRLDGVRTPLLIEAFEPSSVLGEWQWFAGLKRLGKPVDLVYLPAGTHVLVKPWDRMVSQEATADWFSFWLEGKEDSDPEKAEQYRHWRKLQSQ